MSFTAALQKCIAKKLSAEECLVKNLGKQCGTFLRIRVVSRKFDNQPLLDQHRMVADIIEEQGLKLHGYTIETIAPKSTK
mmetsp:Transcript_33192/g.51889  ORF Transcript_33192/g.51889 Transcript_33192/m.51889 type:complete len:80 (-) Transcript_33192:98-337(-)